MIKDKIYSSIEAEPSGAYRNLNNQITSLFNNTRHDVSIKTRYKYLDIERAFCRYLCDSSPYKLQKLENIKSKHLSSYINHLKEEGVSVSTLKTTASAIRYFHRLTGSKNILLSNDALELGKRNYREYDRTWTKAEVQECLSFCRESGSWRAYFSIGYGYQFGLRLSESITTITPDNLKNALDSGELWTKGKNGKERYIQIRTAGQVELIKETLKYADTQGLHRHDKILCDNIKGGVQKGRRYVQNYISNNQHRWIDNSRIFLTDTYKKKVERLSYHGLRYTYLNELYSDVYKETGNKDYTLRYCSNQLGHSRKSCIGVYKQM